MAAQHTQIETNKHEFRWSFRKKGKDVLKLCRQMTVVVTLAGGIVVMAAPANANPSGGNVTAGSATISTSGTTTTINQTSGRAIIEWDNFDIAAGETTQFIQPSTSSLALNRVVNSNQATAINGNLTANGRVLVINPNGVLIGPSGNVDVSGFVASTADIDNTRFMTASGAMEFDRAGKLDASVENNGRITIRDAGLGVLVAPVVRNNGVIEGHMAKLQLGAGDTFGVDMYGDGLLHLAVGSTGGARTIKAENAGTIVADAGKVVMTAAAANNVVNSVINTSGVIEAKGLVNKGGEIILTGAGASVKVAGKIDASGKTGGGTVKIGGDVKGADTLAKAKTVDVAAGAEISANANTAGDGGTIAVWSEDKTTTAGSYSAKGGSESGNGGFVETSSKDVLDVSGTFVDTSAVFGAYGLWLLDPTYFSINSGNISSINNATSDVLIYSVGTIDVNHDINMVKAGISLELYAQFGDVNINGRTINLNGGNLVVDAGGQVFLSNSTVNTNGGDVNIYSYATDSGKGVNIADSSIFTKGGDVGIYGKGLTLFGWSAGNTVDIRRSNINTTGGTTNSAVAFKEDGTTKQADALFTNSAVRRDQKGGSVKIEGKDVNGTKVCIAAGGVGCGVDIVVNVNGNDLEKVYGSDDPTLGYSYSGLLAGDSITGAVTRDAGQDVGDYAITRGTLNAVSSQGLDNYVINYVNGNLEITKADLIIKANDQTKVYGDAMNYNNGGPYTVTGLQYQDKVDTTNGQIMGGWLPQHDVGTYDINIYGATGQGLSNYNITFQKVTLTVTQAPLTVTSASHTKIYGQQLTSSDLPSPSATFTGLKNGDTVTSWNTNYDGGYLQAPVGTYDVWSYVNEIVKADGVTASLSNYNITYIKGVQTVTPAALTIVAKNQTKTYGDVLNLGNSAFSVNGLKSWDNINVDLSSAGTAATANVGNYAITLDGVSGNALGNYAISYVPGTIKVNPALLLITADSFSKTYGQAHTFDNTDYGVYGLKNNDTVTGVTMTSNGAAANANVGLYGIFGSNATGTGLANYKILYTPGLMLVNPAALTITAKDQSKTYGETLTFDNAADFTFAGLMGWDSINTVNLSSTGAAGMANVNSYKINVGGATGTGLQNYKITYVKGNLDVTPASLTITALDQAKTFTNQFVFTGNEFSSTGLVNGDTIDSVMLSSAGSAAAAPVGSYAITAGGASGARLGNYTISYVDGTMTVNMLPAGISPTVMFDTLGRPVVSVANNVIAQDRFSQIETRTLDTDVALRYRSNAPTSVAGGNAAAVLAALEPAAGGDDVSAEDLANLEPAAGGDSTPAASGNSDVDCANSFLDNQPCGLVQ